MAVNVQQSVRSEDGSYLERYVEEGHHLDVCDGALVVLDAQDGRQVAVFAPGTWLSAQVED